MIANFLDQKIDSVLGHGVGITAWKTHITNKPILYFFLKKSDSEYMWKMTKKELL